MFKYLRGKRHKSTTRRPKISKECFAFKETLFQGFLYHPTCMAYDSTLGLLAIGTQQGAIRVFGKPGVELDVKEENGLEIRHLTFIEGRGQLIVLCQDNTLSLWEINIKKLEDASEQSFLEKVKTCHSFRKEQNGKSYESSEGNLKQITSLCVDSTCKTLLVGMQGGNISTISLDTFDLNPEIIYQDVVIQNMPDAHKKSNPGSVETIIEKPHDPDRLLIGYNRGLIVLWNKKTLSAENFYIADQQLESVCWLSDGEGFVSSHNDGIYIRWKITDNLHPSEKEVKEYGPYPCKSIHKIIAQTTIHKEELLIFEGGLPRADYRDKNSVSIIKKSPENKKHHTFDLESRVIDFVVIPNTETRNDKFDSPEALIVLTEEEIVAIDLQSPDWLQYSLPYLSCLHSSAVTYAHYHSDIPLDVYKKIEAAGAKQSEGKYSSREWPIKGGIVTGKPFNCTNDFLITGHEDGSVHFWAAGDVDLRHVYRLETAPLFNDDIPDIDAEIPPNEDSKEVEEQWPPFRKVGVFDPMVDDLRLQIQRFLFSPLSSTLIVAGSAGQVIVFTLKDDDNFSASICVENMNIIGENESFIWKGEPKLKLRTEKAKFIGFEPLVLIQTNPPSHVTSLAWHAEWNLLAIGNAYGFGLYDFVQHTVVVAKSTLNPRDSEALAEGDALISRRKSFKKSLRESIRRLRRVKSQREVKKSDSFSPTPSSTPTKGSVGDRIRHTRSPTKDLDLADSRPIERRIEARQADEITGPVVRYLYLGLCGIDKKESTQLPTLWAGTQAGVVYALSFNIPGLLPPLSPSPSTPSAVASASPSKDVKDGNEIVNEKPVESSVDVDQAPEEPRKTERITFMHGREIRLAHKAPVIFIHLIDATGYPLPDPLEVKYGRARAASTADKVLVCTEEQFILYTLPQLKHYSKYKLTAEEGLKARKIAFSQFESDSDEIPPEDCLVCLSNSGEVEVFSSELEQRLKCSCISPEDRFGISHLIFTPQSEGLYLHSPCEYRRFTLSPKRLVEPRCLIAIAEGVRPPKLVETPATAAPKVEEEKGKDGQEGGDVVPHKNSVEAENHKTASNTEPPTSEKSPGNEEMDRLENHQDPNESERDDIKEIDVSKINLNGHVEEKEKENGMVPANDTVNEDEKLKNEDSKVDKIDNERHIVLLH